LNKQQYLAELQRLLVFMTEEDREKTVHRYGELFDAAEPDGAAQLIERLGSPTKAAIRLSRGYEPGQVDSVLPAIKTPEPPPQDETKAQPQPEEAASFWDDLPEFELPDLDGPLAVAEDKQAGELPAPEQTPEQAPKSQPEAQPGSEQSPQPEPAPEPVLVEQLPGDEATEEPMAQEAVSASETPAAEPQAFPEYPEPRQDEPWRKAYEAEEPEEDSPLPLGVGISLFVLVMVALGLPLLALCLGVMAALLVPGCAGLFGAYLAAVGGLWCLGYIADAVLMFGLAFLILALGLIILWLGVWLDIKLAGLYVRGVSWLSGQLLGRSVTQDE
jgi:hypothetical protein